MLPANGRENLIARLDRVSQISHDFGYGVGDSMDYLLAGPLLRQTCRKCCWAPYHGRREDDG
jgi:hypothetical protein